MDDSNLPPFDATIWFNRAEFVVTVKGDFRSGSHLEALKEVVLRLAASTNYKMVLDLSTIIYWDSDGMHFAKHTMQNGSVKMPYDKHLRNHYKIKFGD